MAFDEVRLPENVERGATGGPEFNTTVITLASGYEKRNQNWSEARGSWSIGYGIQTKADFQQVLDFFYARRGKARGFRFKDWSDYEMTDEIYATGDGIETQFQLYKPYASGPITYSRPLQKIVSGTFSTTEDNISVSATVDVNTGVVTYNSAPADGSVLRATCEFDVPVRFDTDTFAISLEIFDAGEVPDLELIELRLPLASI